MKSVKIEKKKLLKALKKNLKKHVTDYKEAEEGYREKIVALMEKRRNAIIKGKKINLVFSLSAPNNYEKEYTKVIQMIEMSIDDDIILTQQEFSQYILDDWSWSDHFGLTNALYKK